MPLKMAESKTSAAKVSLPTRVVASKVRITDPGHRKDQGQSITDLEQSYLNTSVNTLRNIPPADAIRALTRFNGVFSAAVHSYVQLAMSGYKVTGYKVGTHEFDAGATKAAANVVASADTLYDYTYGYASKQSIDGLLETLLKEAIQSGACGMELVLNRFRLPETLIAVPTSTLRWKSKSDGGHYPVQVAQTGSEISLDIPTFFYAATHKVSNSIFARSPLEPALQSIFVFTEFLEDLSRVLRRSGHSRLVASLVQENIKNSAPPAVRDSDNPEDMRKYFEDTRSQIETLLRGLNPDDALVSFDSVKFDLLSSKGEKADYASLMSTLGTMVASALKSMPSVLGLSQGSQNLATTEALVYLKMVRSIQVPVETVMSRAITLAVRLLSGTDSYCKLTFDKINLRPDDELSAHQSVMFQQEMRKLSLGLYEDDEFAHYVGTGPRAPGAPKLSGTMFMDVKAEATQPKDIQANDGAQPRNLNEGTKQGSPSSQPGGARTK